MTGSGEASNGLLVINFAARSCSFCNFFIIDTPTLPPGGVHNMLRVRVCAAHMGGFLGPKFSKQGSLFRQIFLKQGWVIQKLAKNSKKWVVFRQNSS